MKGEILFEKMTGISEEYITEAALVPALGKSPAERPESRFAALSRVLNSGWGVACICFVVAMAAVVGMVAWGRMGGSVTPSGDPSTRFAFSYEITGNDDSAWSGTAFPGDVVNVSTTIVNHGPPFSTYDFFAHGQFVLQNDESIVIEGHYPVIYYDKHTVEIGETGSRTFHFHIPENATPGVYDLVLSYDGVQQVFSGVLSIGKTKPPIDTTDRHAFSFGYEPFGGFSLVNSYIIMETWVVNEGSPFLYTGCSGGYAPSAVLIHTESGYRIEGIHVTVMNYIEIPIRTGEEGRCNQEFFIPADAPTGDYALELSYGGSSRRFDNVLTVAEPTVEDNTHIDPDDMWEIAEQYIPQVAVNVDRIYYTRGGYSHTSDYTRFSFRVTILGMQTTESLYITLGNRGEYLSHEQNSQTYSLFIPYITAEMVEAAKPPLYEHPDYPLKLRHQYGYTLRDGDLYLTYHCYDDSHYDCECAPECYYSTSVFLCADPQAE